MDFWSGYAVNFVIRSWLPKAAIRTMGEQPARSRLFHENNFAEGTPVHRTQSVAQTELAGVGRLLVVPAWGCSALAVAGCGVQPLWGALGVTLVGSAVGTKGGAWGGLLPGLFPNADKTSRNGACAHTHESLPNEVPFCV